MRPSATERRLIGKWTWTETDGQEYLCVFEANHDWSTWGLNERGEHTMRQSSGRWNLDGDRLEFRQHQGPGAPPTLIDILVGQAYTDRFTFTIRSAAKDQIVVRYDQSGRLVEWIRLKK